MSAVDWLTLVYQWLPGAFLLDFLIFGVALWLGKVKMQRRERRKT